MQTKLLVALFVAFVVFCSIVPAEVESAVGKFYVVNKSICESKTRSSTESYSCSGCCKARGYTDAKDNGNYCKCSKKGNTREKTGDEVIEKGGFFGRDNVHESAYEAPEGYASMSHEYGY